MRRKQGEPTTSKKQKEGGTKPAEHGRVGKRPHNKPAKTDGGRRDPPRSKPGYSLYSAAESDVPKTVKSKNPGQGAGGKRQPHSSDMIKKQGTDIMTQMQIQAERAKAAQASGIVIPTADLEVNEDFTLIGSMDLPDVSTPFNKRLISSTPDPEKLLEAELLEQQRRTHDSGFSVGQNQQSLRSSPQMIPEKDEVKSFRAPTVLMSIATGLSEKLKQQKQQLQEQHMQKPDSQAQHSNRPSHHQWKHHLQQYQQDGNFAQEQYSAIAQPWESQKPDSARSIQSKPSMSPPLTVSKAEWVDDNPQEPLSSKRDTGYETDWQQTLSNPSPPTSLHSKSGPTSSLSSNRILHPTKEALTSVIGLGANIPSTVIAEDLPSQNIYPVSKLDSLQEKDNYEEFRSWKQAFPSPRTNSSPVFNTISNLDKTSKPMASQGQDTLQNALRGFEDTSPPVEATILHTTFKPGQVAPKPGSSVWTVRTLPSRKIAPPKDKGTIHNIKKTPSKEKKKSALDKRGEDIPPSSVSVISIPTATEDAPAASDDPSFAVQDLNSSADTCDMEVNDVICKSVTDRSTSDTTVPSNKPNKVDNDSDNHQGTGRASASSTSSNLSQVIEFLKTSAFNKIQINRPNDDQGDPHNDDNNDNNDQDKTMTESDDVVEGTKKLNQPVDGPGELKQKEATPADADYSLSQLINQYLPKTDEHESLINRSKVQDNVIDENAEFNEKAIEDSKQQDKDLNENAKSNLRHSRHYHARPMTRTPKNLHFLEKMADPILRDIACQLAFKATALRDVELRDLIDDMIFHTDAALGKEDARFQSAQMFFAEENSKLKKRIQTINRQLETKERQERLGGNALGLSNNDVLQLERKIMYLRQEKDKLDTQVTALLEEKAKWLITQQDLIKTISLKDHELLKLEEKNHEEKKALLQSLDQATKNSQGVHYKLSVADKEISNLEQRLKCKDLDIGDLKEKLKKMEAKWRQCEEHSLKKDQEMLRLQDLVDTLKIGVDHVLQAYEASTGPHLSTTGEQRQGIENLRQMVHPEQYSITPDSRAMQRDPQNVFQEREPHEHHRDSQSVQQLHKRKDAPIRPQPQFPTLRRPGPMQRPQELSDDRYFHKHRPRGQSRWTRNEEIRDLHVHVPPFFPDEPINHLTSRALEEHNRRLSPIDRSLWRSLDDGPVVTPIQGEEPYYSDSEIHVNGRAGHRRSSQRYSNAAMRDFGPYDRHYGRSKSGEAVTSNQEKRHRVIGRDLQSHSQELQGHRTLSKTDRRRRKSESDKYDYRQIEDRNPVDVGRVVVNDDTLATVSAQSWREIDADGGNCEKLRYSGTENSRKYPEDYHAEESHRRSNRSDEINARRDSQSTQYSTLRSQTLPATSSTKSTGKRTSQNTYYSTLMSKSLPPDNYESHRTFRDEPHDRYHQRRIRHSSGQRQSHSFDEFDHMQQMAGWKGEVTDEKTRGVRHSQTELKSVSHSPRDGHQRERGSQPSTGGEQSLLRDSRDSTGLETQFVTLAMDSGPHSSKGSSRKDPCGSDTAAQYVTLRLDESSGTGYRSSRVSEQQSHSHAFHHSKSHSLVGDISEVSLEYNEPDRYRRSSQKNSDRSLDEWQLNAAEDRDMHQLSVSQPHPQHRRSQRQETQQDDNTDMDVMRNPLYTTQSDFFSGRSTLPTQSSPVHISDISVSRRATRGSDTENLTQRDFFQGTELSASLSSISDSDVNSQNNYQQNSLDEDPFTCGIATLDAKIAMLQKKIDRTKSMFS